MKQISDFYTAFISAEIEEIKRHKWIESEKAGKDLGDQPVLEWIQSYGQEFRRHFMNQLQQG